MESSSIGVDEAVKDILERLRSAQRPVMFVGVQIRRFNFMDKVIALAEALHIPVVTSILGKASFPETHPISSATTLASLAIHACASMWSHQIAYCPWERS